ncbi:Gfo/Idh/MocA family protein [Brachybacterium saurashtrense]|uniref:Gfo/Idh/MocA family oxidoreductase n=1 Tax=Brachybacterium saurashtrense TaxID=556288 RepID=A0A345YS90_9MICO|nr:Gfo/Idh/MocA family oxidoreductase [Brachybacterium saurashtrense]AXK46792.1 gfo/Idh/MocA family oxidoreductase [Brachybacterium saurashtrense]RRR22507.1 gfo/Idh/MocA family oxidoreductase [Brachybacterium saurashtrense]
MTVRIGVIGCGDVSVVHFEAIRDIEGLELVGVADTDPQALARAVEATGVPGFASTQELIDGVGPVAVHVTTPHDAHIDPSLTALAAGVHVLQEKPLAHTLEEGRRLVDALAAAPTDGPKVGICFQNRYNLASQRLHQMLRSGELGAVRGAWASVVWTRTAEYYRAKPWRGTWAGSGGGLLINQAIHTLDLVQWLLGGVERTDGHVATRKYGDVIEVEDTAELLLHHPGGITTSFYATLTAPQHRPVEIELDCENAYVTLRGGTDGGLTIRWADGRVDTLGERSVTSGGRSYWGVSHELLIRDFHARLAEPEPFWIGPQQAMASLEILKEAYRLSGVGPRG